VKPTTRKANPQNVSVTSESVFDESYETMVKRREAFNRGLIKEFSSYIETDGSVDKHLNDNI